MLKSLYSDCQIKQKKYLSKNKGYFQGKSSTQKTSGLSLNLKFSVDKTIAPQIQWLRRRPDKPQYDINFNIKGTTLIQNPCVVHFRTNMCSTNTHLEQTCSVA